MFILIFPKRIKNKTKHKNKLTSKQWNKTKQNRTDANVLDKFYSRICTIQTELETHILGSTTDDVSVKTFMLK